MEYSVYLPNYFSITRNECNKEFSQKLSEEISINLISSEYYQLKNIVDSKNLFKYCHKKCHKIMRVSIIYLEKCHEIFHLDSFFNCTTFKRLRLSLSTFKLRFQHYIFPKSQIIFNALSHSKRISAMSQECL